MVKDIRFATCNYGSLTAGLSDFHFVARMVVAVEKLHNRAILWYKALMVNILPYTMQNIHMLSSEGLLYHVN